MHRTNTHIHVKAVFCITNNSRSLSNTPDHLLEIHRNDYDVKFENRTFDIQLFNGYSSFSENIQQDFFCVQEQVNLKFSY